MPLIAGHVECYLALWLVSARGELAETAAAQARRLAPAVMGAIQGFAIQTAIRGDASSEASVDSARALLAPL